MASERESTLTTMRAVQFVIVAVTLFLGLPTLAHAHPGHGHQDATNSQPVQFQNSTEAAPSATLAMQMVATQAINMTGFAEVSAPAATSHHSVMATSQHESMHACSGGCCCSGSSSCGAGSCCPTFITSNTAVFDIQGSSNPIAHRLYHSASLLLILGLDRPPKS